MPQTPETAVIPTNYIETIEKNIGILISILRADPYFEKDNFVKREQLIDDIEEAETKYCAGEINTNTYLAFLDEIDSLIKKCIWSLPQHHNDRHFTNKTSTQLEAWFEETDMFVLRLQTDEASNSTYGRDREFMALNRSNLRETIDFANENFTSVFVPGTNPRIIKAKLALFIRYLDVWVGSFYIVKDGLLKPIKEPPYDAATKNFEDGLKIIFCQRKRAKEVGLIWNKNIDGVNAKTFLEGINQFFANLSAQNIAVDEVETLH